MPDRYDSLSPTDTRFQFEVIRNLAESVRINGEVMRDIQTTQISMLERLARIEEHRVHEAIAEVTRRVDAIERVHDQETGAAALRKGIIHWWPVIGMFLLVLWTAGRALGFFHIPDRDVDHRKEVPAIERQRDDIQ